uniref:Uncharacterized protein n=1 Tax=Picea sitchensis TaxID=3332 RepID=D5A8M4_PICSI|nr:unknown [Picea sitchensis]
MSKRLIFHLVEVGYSNNLRLVECMQWVCIHWMCIICMPRIVYSRNFLLMKPELRSSSTHAGRVLKQFLCWNRM